MKRILILSTVLTVTVALALYAYGEGGECGEKCPLRSACYQNDDTCIECISWSACSTDASIDYNPNNDTINTCESDMDSNKRCVEESRKICSTYQVCGDGSAHWWEACSGILDTCNTISLPLYCTKCTPEGTPIHTMVDDYWCQTQS